MSSSCCVLQANLTRDATYQLNGATLGPRDILQVLPVPPLDHPAPSLVIALLCLLCSPVVSSLPSCQRGRLKLAPPNKDVFVKETVLPQQQVEQGLGLGTGYAFFNRSTLSMTRFVKLRDYPEGSTSPPPVLVLHGRRVSNHPHPLCHIEHHTLALQPAMAWWLQ